jgi:predicted nucleotidyltransferase
LLLSSVLLSPDREYPVSELCKIVGVSLPTALREVQRAEQAGIATTRVVGRARLVRANVESVLYEPMSRLLLLTFGPARVVAEEFVRLDGLDSAYLYGSWAARYEGRPGPSPRDIDVLVIGTPDRDAAYAAAERVERRLGRAVQVALRTSRQWAEPENDSFLQEVRRRPLVRVLPADAEVNT